MNDLFYACLFTCCCLLTMVFTTPGGVLPGFKLKSAIMLGPVGVALVLITKYEIYVGIGLIESRVETMLCVWMALSWLVILLPYSKQTKARLK